MPIYQFRCNNCQRTCETLMRMSDEDLVTLEGCPDNGGSCEIERLFSRASIRAHGIDRSEDLLHAGKQTMYQPEQTITRDFMTPDGKLHSMKPGEYSPAWVGKDA